MTGVTTEYDKASSNDQNQAPVGDESNQVDARHREHIFEVNPGAYTSYLKFKDEQHTWYTLPLGKTPSRAKEQANPHNNVLVPVVPLVYTTPDCDPSKADKPRPGYLYIYRGDYLWRELEVLEHGYMRDVNLRYYQGRDYREATVERDMRILLPYKIGNQTDTLWMCYSEIQWSWARINAMGGMDPKDVRRDETVSAPTAQQMGIDKSTALKNRQQRMQQIDLSGYPAAFPNTPPSGRKARIGNTNDASSQTYHMKLHRKSNTAKVYLHDPMGIAMSNIEEYYACQLELMHQQQKVTKTEHYQSAVLAYRTFYDTKLWKKAKRKKRQRGPSRYENNSDTDELLRDCAAEMDKNKIAEDILRVTKRKGIRARMRAAKKIHVQFLEGIYADKPLSSTNPDFVPVIPALLDYAELPAPHYMALWSATRALIHFLNVDPTQFDSALDLEEHVQQERGKPEDDIGVQYLLSLLQPDNEDKQRLHAALFPSQQQINEYAAEFNFENLAPERPNGTGEYRPAAVAATINTYTHPPRVMMKNIEDALKEPDKIIADFIYCFTRQWELAQKGKTSVNVDVLFRLLKGTHIPEIRGAMFVQPNQDIADKVIVSADVTVYEKLKRSQRRSLMEASVKGEQSDLINIIKPGTEQILMTTEIAQLPNYKGVPFEITHEKWMEVFRQVDTKGTVRARAKLVVVPVDNPYAVKWHIPEVATSKKVSATVAIMRAGDKGLPPILGVIEAWNLISAVNKIATKGIKGKEVVTAVVAFLGVSFAVVDVTARLAGNEAAEKLVAHIPGLKNASPYLYRKQIKLWSMKLHGMATFGAGVAGLGAVMATWDAIDSFNEDDDDAAAAYVVMAVAGLGAALAAMGQAGVAVLAGFGPFGWAFITVVILAGIIAYLLKDTPLEKWAKHGPFALDIADRISQEYKGYDALQCLQSLYSLLLLPQIKVERLANTSAGKGFGEHDMVVECIVPGFEVNKSTIDLRATVQTGRVNQRGQAFRWTSKQETVYPYKIQPVYADDQQLQQIGARYYYHTPKALRVKFRARLQHITADQLRIPTYPKQYEDEPDSARPRDGVHIDNNEPGWVYTDMMLRYRS